MKFPIYLNRCVLVMENRADNSEARKDISRNVKFHLCGIRDQQSPRSACASTKSDRGFNCTITKLLILKIIYICINGPDRKG